MNGPVVLDVVPAKVEAATSARVVPVVIDVRDVAGQPCVAVDGRHHGYL